MSLIPLAPRSKEPERGFPLKRYLDGASSQHLLHKAIRREALAGVIERLLSQYGVRPDDVDWQKKEHSAIKGRIHPAGDSVAGQVDANWSVL